LLAALARIRCPQGDTADTVVDQQMNRHPPPRSQFEENERMTPDQYAKLAGVSLDDRPTLSGRRLGELTEADLNVEADLWKRVEEISRRLVDGSRPTPEERALLDDFVRLGRRMWSWALGLPD
jgi:hypothetical protein